MSTAVMSTSALYEFGDILYKVNIFWNVYACMWSSFSGRMVLLYVCSAMLMVTMC
jgi:hypothetical protein